MLDHFFQAVLKKTEPPISLREGLRMTLPGIFAEQSTKQKGAILDMRYPWDPDWNTCLENMRKA